MMRGALTMNMIPVSSCSIFFGVALCVAQSNSPPKANNWGPRIQGVQMSLSMTNYVVETESPITVVAVIKKCVHERY